MLAFGRNCFSFSYARTIHECRATQKDFSKSSYYVFIIILRKSWLLIAVIIKIVIFITMYSFIFTFGWLLQGAGTVCNICLTDWPTWTSQENQLLAHCMPSLGSMWAPKAQQSVRQSRASYQVGGNLNRVLPRSTNAFPETLTEEL